MVETISMIFALILPTNLLMSAVKLLSTKQESVTWLRVALMLVSLLGVIAGSALTGEPIDMDSLSSLGKALLEVVVLAIAAHFSYKTIKTA